MPIPGSRSRSRVEENTAAADITLSKTEMDDIDDILPRGGFGARYAKVPTWI